MAMQQRPGQAGPLLHRRATLTVAATVLLTLNHIVAEVSGINRKFRRVVQGSPSLLIHDGELLTDHLKRKHLTLDEVMRALREHGIGSVTEVAIGVLEVDGSFSFGRRTSFRRASGHGIGADF